jgi:hypothetical protein
MKDIRMNILGAWQTYSPAQIVRIFRKAYPNIRTLSVMISCFKKELSELESPPPATYLEAIKLQEGESKAINRNAAHVRFISGLYSDFLRDPNHPHWDLPLKTRIDMLCGFSEFLTS